MARFRNALPQLSSGPFIHYVGMETDLIFNHGVELPGFASYPLLETEAGRGLLRGYYSTLLKKGRELGVGIILDSTTWVANQDRGAAIGYTPDQLRRLNLAAVELMAEVRDQEGASDTVLCAQMGPRGDGYTPADLMTAEEAEAYHSEQMETLSQTDADYVAGFTLAYPEEAIGIIRAGQQLGMPVSISFTVETDGRLPTGMPLGEAISAVDAATDGGAQYFLINCAHPDHFSKALSNDTRIERLKGCVVNASRCSHAELDEATELDAGDPEELGKLLGRLAKAYPHFTVFGGCCGTDMRHIEQICKTVCAVRM